VDDKKATSEKMTGEKDRTKDDIYYYSILWASHLSQGAILWASHLSLDVILWASHLSQDVILWASHLSLDIILRGYCNFILSEEFLKIM
jgi:hypothetical protein